MLTTVTPEQARAFAPDAASVKAAEKLAIPTKWVSLHQSEQLLWGTCKGSGKEPYQTAVTLNEVAFYCSCPSRKIPCKHALSLLFLYSSQASCLTTADVPGWASEWQAARTARQAKAASKRAESVADPAAQAKRAAKRQQNVDKGVALLERWLYDLIGQGLIAAQKQPPRYWHEMAARLVDAQAPGLARLVQQTAVLRFSGDGWHEQLLQQLARLHLLVQGSYRLDQLPPERQADVRTAVGWPIKQEDVLALPSVADEWLVMGHRTEEQDRLNTQFTWLWGQHTQQPALFLEFAYGKTAPVSNWLAGGAYAAELAFYPGSVRLRALSKTDAPPRQTLTVATDGLTLSTAVAQFNQMLAQNPWLESVAFPLADVIPIVDETGWYLQDAAHYRLPLHGEPWTLLALSGGHPLTITAEWNGARWLSLAAWSEGQLRTLV